MFPYFLLVGAPMLTAALSQKFRVKQFKKHGRAVIAVFFVILMTMLALRDVSCGVDIANYKTKFDDVVSTRLSLNDIILNIREPMYTVWQKLVGLFTHNYQIFLALTGILCLAPVMCFYIRESEFPMLTIVLFLCLGTFSMYFSGLRQAIAMGFSIPAWYLAKRRENAMFFLTVLLAVLFHNSAMVIAFIYPLYHVKITKRALWIIIPAIICCFMFNEQIFGVVGILLESYSDRYVAQISGTGAYTMLILFAMLAVFSYVIPDDDLLDKDTIAMRNILLLIVVFQCFVPLNSVAMRINYYFIVFVPILIPKIIKRTSYRMNQIATLSVIVFIGFFTYYFFHQAYNDADILQIFPYVPFWKG